MDQIHKGPSEKALLLKNMYVEKGRKSQVKALQLVGTASTKVQRQEHSWHAFEPWKRPEWLDARGRVLEMTVEKLRAQGHWKDLGFYCEIGRKLQEDFEPFYLSNRHFGSCKNKIL